MKNITRIKDILKTNKQMIMEEYGVKEIALFGSYVRGEQKRNSDIDVIVEFKTAPDLLRFIELERLLHRKLGEKIDLVRKKSIRKELRQSILKEAVAI